MTFTTRHIVKSEDTKRMKGKASGFLYEVNNEMLTRTQIAERTGFTRGRVYWLLTRYNMSAQQIIDKYGIHNDSDK